MKAPSSNRVWARSVACIRNLKGGTGLRPVVSGVAPETVAGRANQKLIRATGLRTLTNEIRRDAGFDGRDARATLSKRRLGRTLQFDVWSLEFGASLCS
jgi:hypothetical protein